MDCEGKHRALRRDCFGGTLIIRGLGKQKTALRPNERENLGLTQPRGSSAQFGCGLSHVTDMEIGLSEPPCIIWDASGPSPYLIILMKGFGVDLFLVIVGIVLILMILGIFALIWHVHLFDYRNIEIQKRLYPMNLEDFLDFKDFNWAQWWNDETRVLKPQLEKMGYTDIEFAPGETDSFGPLTRMCYATFEGERMVFMYG